MKKILVAIDESKVSEAVLEKARAIATVFEADVLVTTAIQNWHLLTIIDLVQILPITIW